MKKTAIALYLSAFLAGCQSAGEPATKKEEPDIEQTSKQEQNIIAELKQTTEDTALRNAAYEDVLKSDTLTGGYLGENTPELQEDLGVQSIEADAVMQVIGAVYGDFYDYGIMYGKNQTSGAAEPGIWVGIKKPDEKADELVRRLQKQADEGKILAKYIHLFESEYSDKDNEVLMYNVSKAIKPMKDAMPEPDRVALGVSVDTITRTIEIGHDFLTKEQMTELKKQFSEYDLAFTQEGRMLPLPGEPDVEYPDETVTRELSTKGSWVMSVSEEEMLVMDAKPNDFSANGGEKESYGAVFFQFPKADEKLKVGQRVIVEASGPIMESYPGQGGAKFVTVLPTYQPDNADLTEEEVVRSAISQHKSKGSFAAIRRVQFEEASDQWTVTFVDSMQPEPNVTDIVVADQK